MAVGLGAAIQLLRYKNRLIWRKLWELDARNENLENALISVRKEQFLARIPSLRLPPRAPSQHGEELVIWEFFAGQRCGFFVEIGAYDGVTFSNTYLLEAAGWNGILVEANPRRFQECRKERPYSSCVQAAVVANRAMEQSSLWFQLVKMELIVYHTSKPLRNIANGSQEPLGQ